MAERICPPDHKHQTNLTCYASHGCQCRPCSETANRKVRERRRLRAYGRYERRVPITGTVRRLQGLQVLGWRLEDVSQLVGMERRNLQAIHKASWVTPETRDEVIEATRVLLNRGSGTSNATRNRAIAKGWVSPLAWENIDDPNETPTGVERQRTIAGEELTNEIEWLVEGGVSARDISRTLGKTLEALEHHAWRHKRNDLASALREKAVA